MWTRSVAANSFTVVDVKQTFFTLIPSRFPTIDVFARVANGRSKELAEIESLTNPRLKERERILRGGAAIVDDSSPLLQNWNHAPFTYHNPEGSRFFGPEHPVLELFSDIQTALSVSIWKRERFLSRTSEAPTGLEMRELSRTVKGRFVDGRDWDPDLDIDTRYKRGRQIMDAGFDGLLYRPPERGAGFCVCVLRGEVLDRAVQGNHFKFVWDGKLISRIYSFGSGKEYVPEDLRGSEIVIAA